MKAGRELNQAVAEALGWTDFFTSDINGAFLGLPPGISRPRSGNTAHHERVPEFSTDIRAAWQVVEKMRGEDGDNLGFNLTDENMGPWTATFLEYQPQNDGPAYIEPKEFRGDGETPALAICLAALAALGASAGEKEGKGERK